jgi:hypothetical protein
MPIQEKMYPNLVIDSTARNLEARAHPLKFIHMYNTGWLLEEVGNRMADDALR